MDKSEQTRPKEAKRDRFMCLLFTNTPLIDAVRIQRLSMSKMGFRYENCLFLLARKKIYVIFPTLDNLPSTLDIILSDLDPRQKMV